jgi:hypothetical protein
VSSTGSSHEQGEENHGRDAHATKTAQRACAAGKGECATGDAACATNPGEVAGQNVLRPAIAIEDLARQQGKPATTIEDELALARRKLLEIRNRRPRPHTDDKVLVAWNGLAIQAMAYAGRTMDEREYITMAAKAADFILDEMAVNGRLMRSYRDGQTRVEGFLEDYAFLAWGLAELYRADGNKRWLAAATNLADNMITMFEDRAVGGFFFTSSTTPQMPVRSKNILGGGNLPSPNGIAAIVLLELGQLTGQAKYSDSAGRTLAALAPAARQSPSASHAIVLATQQWLSRQKT